MIEYDDTKINGDPQSPDEVNNIFAEAKKAVSSLGLSFASGSSQQLFEAIAVYASQGSYFSDSGSANTYTLSSSPVTRIPVPAYFVGMEVYFLANATNTGASTVNPDGLGAKPIVRKDGSTPLVAGDIVIAELARLVYDGTSFLLNELTLPTATSSILGIASFPTDDFAVNAGVVKSKIARLTWTGNGSASRNITNASIGFTPNSMVVLNGTSLEAGGFFEDGSGTIVGRQFIGASGGDISSSVSGFIADGFQVGTATGYINAGSDLYTAILFGQIRYAG